MNIIGITIGLIAITLIYWFRKDQQMTNDLVEGDVRQNAHALLALQKEFTQYQVDTDRKIANLEKQLEIKVKNIDRRMDNMNKSLPSIIRNVIGHIEYAQPLDKK